MVPGVRIEGVEAKRGSKEIRQRGLVEIPLQDKDGLVPQRAMWKNGAIEMHLQDGDPGSKGEVERD